MSLVYGIKFICKNNFEFSILIFFMKIKMTLKKFKYWSVIEQQMQNLNIQRVTFWPFVTCHLSLCHLSLVTFHFSRANCHLSLDVLPFATYYLLLNLTCYQMQYHSIHFPYSKVFFFIFLHRIEWLERWV